MSEAHHPDLQCVLHQHRGLRDGDQYDLSLRDERHTPVAKWPTVPLVAAPRFQAHSREVCNRIAVAACSAQRKSCGGTRASVSRKTSARASLLVPGLAVSIRDVRAATIAMGGSWPWILSAMLLSSACDPQVLRLLPGMDGGNESPGAGGRASTSGPCTRDGQCSGALARCDIATGRCVECTSTDDCESYETCDRASKRCVVPCSRDDDCSSGSSRSDRCDVARAYCVECIENGDCSPSRGKPICDTSTGKCVECLDAADCETSHAACDPDFHYCYQR